MDSEYNEEEVNNETNENSNVEGEGNVKTSDSSIKLYALSATLGAIGLFIFKRKKKEDTEE